MHIFQLHIKYRAYVFSSLAITDFMSFLIANKAVKLL